MKKLTVVCTCPYSETGLINFVRELASFATTSNEFIVRLLLVDNLGRTVKLFRFSQEACVGINPLPWESQHFCLPMARLEVLAKEGVNIDAIIMLVSEAVAEFKRTTGCQHYFY